MCIRRYLNSELLTIYLNPFLWNEKDLSWDLCEVSCTCQDGKLCVLLGCFAALRYFSSIESYETMPF
jgi:hypothetical protein